LLLEKMIRYARDHGIKRLNAITMPSNQGMITLAKKLGFSVDLQLEDGIVTLSLSLKTEPSIEPDNSGSRDVQPAAKHSHNG